MRHLQRNAVVGAGDADEGVDKLRERPAQLLARVHARAYAFFTP